MNISGNLPPRLTPHPPTPPLLARLQCDDKPNVTVNTANTVVTTFSQLLINCTYVISIWMAGLPIRPSFCGLWVTHWPTTIKFNAWETSRRLTSNKTTLPQFLVLFGMLRPGVVANTTACHARDRGSFPALSSQLWTLNPLSPHDALKHHFASLNTNLILLQLGVFE